MKNGNSKQSTYGTCGVVDPEWFSMVQDHDPIVLISSFRIRVHPFKPGRLNTYPVPSWQIFKCTNWIAARLFEYFQIFEGNICVIKDKLDNFKKNLHCLVKKFRFGTNIPDSYCEKKRKEKSRTRLDLESHHCIQEWEYSDFCDLVNMSENNWLIFVLVLVSVRMYL